MMRRVKTYMEKLIRGIDPISGQEIREDSVLNNARRARCFFYVSGVCLLSAGFLRLLYNEPNE